MGRKMLLAALLLSPMLACAQASGNLVQRTIPTASAELPAFTPDQRSRFVREAGELARDSRKIAEAIDRGQIGLVWDKASSVAKLSRRQDFTRQIFTDRGNLGAPSSRRQAAITFAHSKGGAVPAGLYINISYATQFARKEKPITELISYHLDDDQVWRMAGYSVR